MIKLIKRSLVQHWRASLILVLMSLFAFPGFADMKVRQKDKSKKQTSIVQKVTDNPVTSVIGINNITSYVDSKGFHDALYGSSWNGTFPKGTAGIVYQEGVVWGGRVDDGGSTEIRVGGNTYSSGTSSLEDRVYRVRPDFETATLTDDAASFYIISSSEVTDAQMEEIRAQYEADWIDWPADRGAPYEDVNGNGIYDPDADGDGIYYEEDESGNPTEDIPGIPGASQTIWIRYNDDNATNIYGSPAIGIEVQETYWSYAISNPLQNVIFKQMKLVYAGTDETPANSSISDMYIVQWCDPDIGTYTDDFAGCDTTLSLGFAYNSQTTDATYLSLGMAPPALGYDFLQGVAQYSGDMNDSAMVNLEWKKGYKYVNDNPLSTYVYFAAGGSWEDPELQDYEGTLEWYNLMRGYMPDPTDEQVGFPTPDGSRVGGDGTYLLAGDPVEGTGWIDGQIEGAGDRRICNVTGPFNMALGDTAEIVVALLGGIGSSNLTSLTVLKYTDKFAQFAYDNLFDLPIFPAPSLQCTNLDEEVLLNWGATASTVSKVENASPQGYDFQGYNIYQLPSASSSIDDGIKIATYDVVDEITTILDDELDEETGVVLKMPAQTGSNSGIKRYLVITDDLIRDHALRNGQEYYFAVTAYGYNPDESLPYNSLESSPVIVTAIPQTLTPGADIETETGEELEYVHSGTANASIDVTVVDPSELTGDEYQVFFNQQHYYLDADGAWQKTNYADSIGKAKSTNGVTDVSPSTMSGAGVYSETAGTIDLKLSVNYDSPDYDYIDGVKITLPDGVIINSAESVTDCANGETEDPVIDGQTVMWGRTDTSTYGCFDGGQILELNVSSFTPPLTISYVLYDDGWAVSYGPPYDTLGNGYADATGSFDITEIGNEFTTQYHWNVLDVTTGEVVLEDQTILSGEDIYANVTGPGGSSGGLGSDVGTDANIMFDGLLLALDGSYDSPTSYADYTVDGDGTYDIDDFVYFGYDDATSATTLPLYGGIGGTSSIDKLQQDYELRWTGITSDTTINGHNVIVTSYGGSYATIFGASNYSLGDHPLNPNPGSTDPFTIRIPFEVWNVDTGEQVNLLVYDRNTNGRAADSEDFEVWNTEDRMYVWVVDNDYTTSVVDPSSSVVEENSTWNWVFFESNFATGDVISFTYANPLQLGVDTFTFTAPSSYSYSEDQAKEDVKNINVFPNPYYGYHYRESSRAGKYVTFSHLPDKATIRIFDLSGVLVRTIHKESSSQFTQWDLTNNNNYPVASGIYVVYVDLPDLGTSKILKLAIIQEEQILDVY